MITRLGNGLFVELTDELSLGNKLEADVTMSAEGRAFLVFGWNSSWEWHFAGISTKTHQCFIGRRYISGANIGLGDQLGFLSFRPAVDLEQDEKYHLSVELSASEGMWVVSFGVDDAPRILMHSHLTEGRAGFGSYENEALIENFSVGPLCGGEANDCTG